MWILPLANGNEPTTKANDKYIYSNVINKFSFLSMCFITMWKMRFIRFMCISFSLGHCLINHFYSSNTKILNKTCIQRDCHVTNEISMVVKGFILSEYINRLCFMHIDTNIISYQKFCSNSNLLSLDESNNTWNYYYFDFVYCFLIFYCAM